MLTVKETEKPEEPAMYMCKCCKSIYSTKDSPPVAGMCPECQKSRSEQVTVLYHNVERELSLGLQPGLGHRELLQHVENARASLRIIMRKMGWQGQF